MKNIIISLSFLFGITCATAQVGIGIGSPQKALHISGTSASAVISGTSIQIVSPTVRVEGLNNLNQSTSDKLRPISVTNNGDLVLARPLLVPLIMIDPISSLNSESDYIGTPITVNQASGTSTNTVLRSFAFVLTSPSLVKFGATTSFQFYKASDGTVITDGANRIWGTRFRFSSAPAGISTAANAYFGESLKVYTNSVNAISAAGILYANSEDALSLPAGNYVVDVISSINTHSTQIPARIINGNGNDTMSIVAYPTQ